MYVYVCVCYVFISLSLSTLQLAAGEVGGVGRRGVAACRTRLLLLLPSSRVGREQAVVKEGAGLVAVAALPWQRLWRVCVMMMMLSMSMVGDIYARI